MIENGACISISSGVNVDIWNSPWIPLKPNFRPIPNANLVGSLEFTVADLIIPYMQTWNIHLLKDLFDVFTVQNILNIFLPS